MELSQYVEMLKTPIGRLQILYNYYNEHNTQDDKKFDFNTFKTYLNNWVMQRNIDAQKLYDTAIEHFDRKFKCLKVYDQHKNLLSKLYSAKNGTQ